MGDTVYAMKRKDFLETARVIGQVSKAEPDSTHPLLWDITVEPAFSPEEIADIAIIVMNPEHPYE